MDSRHSPVIIIGGGAAGLFAAHLIRNSLLLEKGPSCGRKLLITGGGACNLTHAEDTAMFVRRYYEKRNFVSPAIYSFPPERIITHFEELGVPCYTREDGKVFPQSNDSHSIRDALVSGCSRILTEAEVKSVRKADGIFTLDTSKGVYTSDILILAAGGRYTPQTGSDGSSYRLAEKLGHTIIPPRPALSPLITPEFKAATLEGLTLEDVTVTLKGRKHTGPLLFTHNGISGPMILNLSRGIEAEETMTVRFASLTAEEIRSQGGKALAGNAVHRLTLLPSRFIENMLECASKQVAALTRADMQKLISTLTECRIKVRVPQDGRNAMVTSGGISTEEVDRKSMESEICPGLFIIGEALDVDGECGGYNLTFAWASAYLAAGVINRRLGN